MRTGGDGDNCLTCPSEPDLAPRLMGGVPLVEVLASGLGVAVPVGIGLPTIADAGAPPPA